MQARIAGATPLYARHDSKAVRLRKGRLPNAATTPFGCDNGDLEDLPLELDDTLIERMNAARGCTTPICPSPFAGMGPVKRGPSQATPRKRKVAPSSLAPLLLLILCLPLHPSLMYVVVSLSLKNS
jgi:hypothetical protein